MADEATATDVQRETSSMKKAAREKAVADDGALKKHGRPKKPVEKKLLELSVTVGIGGGDINIALLSNVECFLREECVSGLCAVERGGSLFNLHFQMVCRIFATSIQGVNKLLKRYLGWHEHQPLGSLVMCKGLRNKNMHMFFGMLGYYVKHLNEQHFRMVPHNVSEEDIQRGVEVYARFGAGQLKNKVCLTPVNVFDRAFVYYVFFLRKRINTGFPSCLRVMLKSGKYYPSADWVTPYQGRGMDMGRACSMWNCMKNPEMTTMRDVKRVFFESAPDPPPPCLDSLIARNRSEGNSQEGLEVSELSAMEFMRAVFDQDKVIPLPVCDPGVRFG